MSVQGKGLPKIMRRQVIVLGAGLAGLTSAWFLRQAGFEVTVFDSREEVANGTSYANAGMLTPSMADPWNVPGIYRHLLPLPGGKPSPMLLRLSALPSLMGWGLGFLRNSSQARYRLNMQRNLELANYSMQMLDQMLESGVHGYTLNQNGTLKVFSDPAEMQAVAMHLQPLIRQGLAVNTLDADGLVRLEPALAPVREQYCGGLHFPADKSGDAQLFCRQLERVCRQGGVEFQLATTVDQLIIEKQLCRGIIAGGKSWHAEQTVVALGPWSPLLTRSAGLKLPIRPVKGYSISLDTGSWPERPTVPVIDEGLHAAITPMGNSLRVAGTAEFAGYDLSLKKARIDNLLHLLNSVYPEFSASLKYTPSAPDQAWAKPWCGLRPMNVDGVPIVGESGIEGLYLNTGHGHLGWTMAAGSGALLADVISGNRTALKQTDYSMARFQ